MPLDITDTQVHDYVQPGDEFQFVFDLGEAWTHQCLVHPSKVDPIDVSGIRAKTPLPYWGGGDIPDQYGRKSMDDDGTSEIFR